MHTVTKIYRDFPAAHRQPKHDGHCSLIHGHNWGWDITFCAQALDECGFVVDVGRLSRLKDKLALTFDHTLLLNEDDPLLHDPALQTQFHALEELAKIVIIPNCGMEGLAKLVYEMTQVILMEYFPEAVKTRGLRVMRVVCWEDSKNASTYTPG